jgi:hypothetical protein
LAVSALHLPIAVVWSFALIAMWYFQPGLPGALVFGGLISAVAALGLALTRFIKEPAH